MENKYQTAEDDDILDLGLLFYDIIRGIRKFWWLLILLVLLCGAAYGAWSVYKYVPMYQAKASFTVATNTSADENYYYDFFYNNSTADQMAKTFPYILDTDLMKDLIRKSLQTDVINGSISAKSVSDSNLFTITVTSRVPEDAEAILNAVIENYPSVARHVIGETKLNMIGAPIRADKPYNTISLPRKAAKGALAGIALDVVALGLYAFFRNTIRKEDEIKNVLNFPCIGSIPHISKKRRSKEGENALTIYNKLLPDSFKETLSSAAIRITNEMEAKGQKVLLVTATMDGEGSSTVAENMMYTLSEMHKSVILVDTNLRGGNNCTAQFGLDNYLKGECQLKDALEKGPNRYCFSLRCKSPMTAFDAANAGETLRLIIRSLAKKVDYVIIDASSCMRFSETAMAAEYADAYLYIIKQDYAKVSQIREGVERLQKYDLDCVGCMLNGATSGIGGYGYGGRYSYYGKHYYGGYYRGHYGNGRRGYGQRYGHYGSDDSIFENVTIDGQEGE